MASWLGPFLPCWEKREAVSVEPFKNILPGILWRSGSSVLSKEELQDPDLLLGGLLLLPGPGTWGEPWRDLLLPPPDDKQDPISRALIKLIKHSKPPTQSKPLFSGDGPFGTLFNSLIARIVNWTQPPIWPLNWVVLKIKFLTKIFRRVLKGINFIAIRQIQTVESDKTRTSKKNLSCKQRVLIEFIRNRWLFYPESHP